MRAAGFEVRVTGGGEGEGEGEGGVAETVSREVFCKWLEVSEVRWGSAVAEWWCRLEVEGEGAVEGAGAKSGDDDTVVDLYRQIAAEVEAAQGRVKAKAKELRYYELVAELESEEDRARVRKAFLEVLTPLEREAEVSGGRVTVGALVEWGREGRGLFEPEAGGDAEGRRGYFEEEEQGEVAEEGGGGAAETVE